MKKVLWSIAAATLIVLTGCSNAAAPIQSKERPPRPVVETTQKSVGPVESETVVLSAGNDQLVDDTAVKEDAESKVEPEAQAEPPAESQPQESQAIVKASVTFVPDSKKETVAPTAPAPSAPAQTPEPEPTSTPAPPVESEPVVEPAPPAASEPAEPVSIDHWISYAQEYAKSIGLNLDTTAVDCWDNPITAGAHCTCLERDIQSRLNRYARDETILDVWVWAESDGLQDIVTFAAPVTDPIAGYLNIKVSYGGMKIVKTAEDGKAAGITLTVTGNGVNETVQTNSAGEIQIDNLAPGAYTVSEQSFYERN